MKVVPAVLALTTSCVLLASCSSQPAALPAKTLTTTAVATVTAPGTRTTETVAGPFVTTTETVTEARPYTTTMTTVAAPSTIVKTVNHPVTVVQTVTETAQAAQAAAPPASSGSSFPNGTYLVGVDIPAGNYKCSAGDPTMVFWRVSDHSGNTINNGFGMVAFVQADAYTTDLTTCDGTWNLVP